ncbi:DNA adenine methylase [Mycoplasma sp. Z386]
MENKNNTMDKTKTKTIPFVKWAGGKRQIIEKIQEKLPKTINRYFEPFVGGGAVLFSIEAKEYYINDINSSLINAYIQIKENPDLVISNLEKLDKTFITKGDYYLIREKYNEKIKNKEFDVELATFFIYLNKRCFNGLYRVNSKGEFNVPFNGKENFSSFSKENIVNISNFLNKKTEIMNFDFATVLEKAKKGDFIFIDSPYDSLENKSFDSYTEAGFDKEEHIRLSQVVKVLDKKGCYIMLTNHNTDLINELYKDFNKEIIKVKRLINRDKNKRTGEEIIITNY